MVSYQHLLSVLTAVNTDSKWVTSNPLTNSTRILICQIYGQYDMYDSTCTNQKVQKRQVLLPPILCIKLHPIKSKFSTANVSYWILCYLGGEQCSQSLKRIQQFQMRRVRT